MNNFISIIYLYKIMQLIKRYFQSLMLRNFCSTPPDFIEEETNNSVRLFNFKPLFCFIFSASFSTKIVILFSCKCMCRRKQLSDSYNFLSSLAHSFFRLHPKSGKKQYKAVLGVFLQKFRKVTERRIKICGIIECILIKLAETLKKTLAWKHESLKHENVLCCVVSAKEGNLSEVVKSHVLHGWPKLTKYYRDFILKLPKNQPSKVPSSVDSLKVSETPEKTTEAVPSFRKFASQVGFFFVTHI